MNGRPGWLQTMVARAQTTLATLLAWLNPAAAAAPLSPNTASHLSRVSDTLLCRDPMRTVDALERQYGIYSAEFRRCHSAAL